MLLKTCKYFDLMDTGNLTLPDFKNTLNKLGVSGFSEENLVSIFNAYADKNSKSINYKAFSKGLYSNVNIKDRFDEVEYIVKKLRKETKIKGFGAFINLLKELQSLANESSIGIIPNQLEKVNQYHKLGLKPEEIERIYFAFYEINCFNYKEFILSIVEDLGESQKDFFENCYRILSEDEKNEITVKDLISAFRPELDPKYENYNDEQLEDEVDNRKQEFREAVKIIIAFFKSKLGESKPQATSNDTIVTDNLFFGFFRIFSFFYENEDDLFSSIIELFQINQRREKLEKTKKEEYQSELNNKKIKEKQKDEKIVLGKVKSEDAPELNKQQLKTLENLRTKLIKLNSRFFIELNKQFNLLDTNNSKVLDFDNFGKAIKLTNVSFFKNEISYIFGLFENKEKGTINYEYFLRTIINMNYRITLINQVFKKLESESITKNSLSSNYILSKMKVKNHPEVLNGNITEDEALDDFNYSLHENFGVKNKQAGK